MTNVFTRYTFTFRKENVIKMGTNGRNIQVQMYNNISIYTMGIKCQELLHPGERNEQYSDKIHIRHQWIYSTQCALNLEK